MIRRGIGIPRGSARLLLEEGKRRPFAGSVLQLGRSSVYFTGRDLARWAARAGVALAAADESRSHDPRLSAQGCLSDTTFFSRLGFTDVQSCDISTWEGADIVADLNLPVSAELHGRFDVVFETGTIVQIFDLPQVLANLHAMVKVGGRIIHCAVPSNNHMDLGFAMLCPTFFADYYAANGYRLDPLYLCEYFAYWHRGRLYSDRWRVYRYAPGALGGLSYGRYGGAQAAVFAVATRLAESRGDAIPQLGSYRQSWQGFARGAAPTAGASADDCAHARLGWGLPRVAKRVIESVRRRLLPRPMPPLVGRY